MILYHGSNVRVDKIDLGKSRPAKDFGRAFYLSAEKEQAVEMAQFKVETFGGEVMVNNFGFDEAGLDGLKFLSFNSYTEEWAKFVLANRNSTAMLHDFDVVYGPIANDRIGRQIFNLQAGYIDLSIHQALSVLYGSKTYQLLKNKRSGLFFQSPYYVYSFLQDEMKTGALDH